MNVKGPSKRDMARAQKKLEMVKPFEEWMLERPRSAQDIELYKGVMTNLKRIADGADISSITVAATRKVAKHSKSKG